MNTSGEDAPDIAQTVNSEENQKNSFAGSDLGPTGLSELVWSQAPTSNEGAVGMTKITDMDRDRAEPRISSARMSTPELRAWFVREVVPLEPELMQYLQHNWRNRSDIVDLRQEVYARVFDAARTQIPERTRQFVFTTARNLLINRVLHEQIVPIEAVADLEALEIAKDAPDPERSVIAREELRRLQVALDRLPPRCREAIVLRKIENLSIHEITQRMGVSEKTVKTHLTNGVRALTEALYGPNPVLRDVP